jgi:hypothetical protein
MHFKISGSAMLLLYNFDLHHLCLLFHLTSFTFKISISSFIFFSIIFLLPCSIVVRYHSLDHPPNIQQMFCTIVPAIYPYPSVSTLTWQIMQEKSTGTQQNARSEWSTKREMHLHSCCCWASKTKRSIKWMALLTNAVNPSKDSNCWVHGIPCIAVEQYAKTVLQ